jgi:hypothetical protein
MVRNLATVASIPLALLAVVPISVSAQTAQSFLESDSAKATTAWANCVSGTGKRLSRGSREPVDTIVKAAFGSCFREQMEVDFHQSERMKVELRQILTDRVTREILEARSKTRR